MTKLNKTRFIFLCFLFVFSCKNDEPSVRQHTLSLKAMEGGTVSIVWPSGTSATKGIYDAGTQVKVKATPKAGYSFVKWSNKETNPTISFTLDASLNLTASFTQQSYTLTINQADGGTVSVSPASGSSTTGGTYDAGTQITVTATPNTGYEFERWSEIPRNSYLNSANSQSPTLNFTINKNVTLTPGFIRPESRYTGDFKNGIYIDKKAEPQYFHKEGNGIAKIVMSDAFLEKNASNYNPNANTHGIRVRKSFKKYYGSKTDHTLYSFHGNNNTSFDAVHTPQSETVIISSSRSVVNPFRNHDGFKTQVEKLKSINALYVQSLENAGVDKAKDSRDDNKLKVATYPHAGVAYVIEKDQAAKNKTIFVAYYGKRRPGSQAAFNKRKRGWVDMHGGFVLNNLEDIIFVELPDDFISNQMKVRSNSRSTPIVAGFAASILAKNRNLTAEQLKTKIMAETKWKEIRIRDWKEVMVNGELKEKLYTERKRVRILSLSKWKK